MEFHVTEEDPGFISVVELGTSPNSAQKKITGGRPAVSAGV
jgi:hypothetical protein